MALGTVHSGSTQHCWGRAMAAPALQGPAPQGAGGTACCHWHLLQPCNCRTAGKGGSLLAWPQSNVLLWKTIIPEWHSLGLVLCPRLQQKSPHSVLWMQFDRKKKKAALKPKFFF